MTSEVKLRLVLTSALQSPEQIGALAELTPTRSWKCGDLVHPRAKNRHKENGCVLEVTDSAFSSAAKRLQEDLQLQSATLEQLPKDIEIELSCVVNVSGAMPELHLDPELVRFAASIGAALDFDIYLLD